MFERSILVKLLFRLKKLITASIKVLVIFKKK